MKTLRSIEKKSKRKASIAAADTTKSAKATVTVINRVYSKVTLLAPNGGEILTGGGTFTIQWGAPATPTSFKLTYSLNNGRNWYAISSSNVTGTSILWKVPTVSATRTTCRVKVVGYNANNRQVGTDQSDKLLTIKRADTGIFSLTSDAGINGGTLPVEYTEA